MRKPIYRTNICAKFHPDPIWNDGVLGFLGDSRPNKKKNNKKSSDMRSVPDPKTDKQINQTEAEIY